MRFTLFLLVCTALFAQSKPDFSGKWKLNRAESDFSDPRATIPDRLTFSIQHQGDSLKYKVEREAAGKKGGFEVELEIGGAPYESDAAGVVSAEWKGNTLIVTTLYNPGSDRASDQKETWSLSSDGKKMMDEVLIHPPRGKEAHIRRVFDKE